MAINNTVDLIMGEDGSQLYLSSRSKNQFFDRRELPLEEKKGLHSLCSIPLLFLILLGILVTSLFLRENIGQQGFLVDLENGGMGQNLVSIWNRLPFKSVLWIPVILCLIHSIKFIASVVN